MAKSRRHLAPIKRMRAWYDYYLSIMTKSSLEYIINKAKEELKEINKK
jgi:hypothetical protein